MRTLIAGFLAASALVVTPVVASTNLVTNGDFSQTTGLSYLTGQQVSDNTGPNGTVVQHLTGWTNGTDTQSHQGYTFVVTGDATAKPTSDGSAANGTGIHTNSPEYIALWGKNDETGNTNGLYETQATHGNYVVSDGVYESAPLFQYIGGLTIGQVYAVSFDYAGAQQYGYSGATTESWFVGLNSTVPTANNVNNFGYQEAPILSDVSHGFTGWSTATLTFTATSASEYLSFFAAGTPGGVPPMSLLDNVSMSAVPEPSSWVMMLGGFGLLGLTMRRSKRARASIA